MTSVECFEGLPSCQRLILNFRALILNAQMHFLPYFFEKTGSFEKTQNHN